MPDKLHPDDIELDRLLARARWPEAGPARLERLEILWFATRRRQRWAAMSLIAASALVALGATGWLISHQGNQAGLIAEKSPEQVPPIAAVAPPETKSQPSRQPGSPDQTPLVEQDASIPSSVKVQSSGANPAPTNWRCSRPQ
ncbi:MAG TPA: hypothetical protein VGJ16_10045 [Pirellulales bacterium]|jgi:hypothetical protein